MAYKSNKEQAEKSRDGRRVRGSRGTFLGEE
jgi:hypothetical protein